MAFSWKKKTIPQTPEQSINSITELFGDEAKADGFNLVSAVKSHIEKSNIATEAAEAFGDAVNNESFDFAASVKDAVKKSKATSTNDSETVKLIGLFGTKGQAAGFALSTAITEALADSKTIEAIVAMFGDKAKAEGFDLTTQIQTLIDANAKYEAIDGAEETNPILGAPDPLEKSLQEFGTPVDAELDQILKSQNA